MKYIKVIIFLFATSIDKIESLTGINFLSGLADDIENKLESNINTLSWSW
jgi:hypothetical protein